MIARLGEQQRILTRAETRMNDAISKIRERTATQTADTREQTDALQAAIQAFCEANRQELTSGGKVKHHDFVTGLVMWRQSPPSVRITKADEVIAALKAAGFTDFIRTKEEVNKEAMLDDQDRAKSIKGISIKSAGESFAIEVKEDQLEQV